MASISGFGPIGGGTPLDKFKSVPGGVQQPAAESNPQVGSDGLDVNFHQAPAAERNTAPAPSAETVQTQETREPAERSVTRNSVPVTLTMDDGLFGVNSIGENAASEKIGLSAFTNGLGSTKLIGLSGNTLADLSPLRQQQ
jgi:hypothetical protein